MTLSEFKAWLDGMSEAMGNAPTPEQWAKIKAKLADVQPFPIAPSVAPSVWRPSEFDRYLQPPLRVTCDVPQNVSGFGVATTVGVQ